MNMDSKDRNVFSGKRLKRSFSYAFCGIFTAWKEANFKIHVMAAFLTASAGLAVQLSKWEWIILFLLFAGMFALEMVNTAIEKIVDLATQDYHPLAKEAKDLAAGAVLVYAIFSVVIGMIIFLPKLFRLFI
jgi:undecaprenol kinase